ncbi:hypothetical protein CAOG_04087 [Capsaspora owczarzaki ATCC 30864]|uniref:Integrin alpha-2 domain-containing protein n=1 Tax=Capsaspora owczarzaki (strain ATCC 30864) TaxID=595528 RepID=A0A0D2WPG8_CAPO3|nr:hypothetical protein CAOG_04087 [Capsaspora owczarzaki ATCC 30864]KJE93275.1 hypothetical protein CAOG_004087 [Capsaspora owczarzaki ATCC 30864]|eukprot:XP_004347912.2 hypothetical protein CAOG_04087 [Capsaspora owczarzaki ATCC 30864]
MSALPATRSFTSTATTTAATTSKRTSSSIARRGGGCGGCGARSSHHRSTLLVLLAIAAAAALPAAHAANNINVAAAWTKLTSSAPGFAKSVAITERPNEDLDIGIEPLVIAGAPDANSFAGQAYLFQIHRDVIGFAPKFTSLGSYAGTTDDPVSLSYNGNATGGLASGTPMGAGMGFYIGTGNITSGADNLNVLLGAQAAEEEVVSDISIVEGFEACSSPPCGSVVQLPIKYRAGQLLATTVQQQTGWRAAGAFFSTLPPDAEFCHEPFPGLMSEPSLLRTYGARPRSSCVSQLGSSLALGRVWNPSHSADFASDNSEIIAGAPMSNRVIVFSLPPGNTPGPVTSTVISPVAAVALASFSTSSSISNVARAALEWGSLFGNSVASGGSLNGDQWDDVAIGSVRRSDTYRQRAFVGSVSVYAAVRDGQSPQRLAFSPQPFFEVFGSHTGSYFGWQVLIANVITTRFTPTQGLPDLLVSAPMESITLPDGTLLPDVGCVYIFVGSGQPTGPFQPYSQRICGRQTGERFGYTIATIGDINADGVTDFAVGAPRYDANATLLDVGCLHVFLGGVIRVSSVADQIICGYAAGATLGTAFAGGIDLTKDFISPPYPDLLVGSPGQQEVLVLQSRAVSRLTISGSANRLSVIPGQTATFTFCVANQGPSDAIGVLVAPRYNYTCGACSVPSTPLVTMPTIAAGTMACSSVTTLAAVTGCCNLEASSEIVQISQGPFDTPQTLAADSVVALARPLTVYVCPTATPACGYNIAIANPTVSPAAGLKLGSPFTVSVSAQLVDTSATTNGVKLTFNVLEGMRLDLQSSLLQGIPCVAQPANMLAQTALRSIRSGSTVSYPSYTSDPTYSRFASAWTEVTCYLDSVLASTRTVVPLLLVFDTRLVAPFASSFDMRMVLSASTPDTVPANNNVTVPVTVLGPKVQVTAHSDQGQVVENYPFTITTRLYNAGGQEARNLVLSVVFPFYAARLIAIPSTHGSCEVDAFQRSAPLSGVQPAGGDVPFICTLRRLAPGETVLLPIVGAYNLTATTDTTLPFSVSLVYGGQTAPLHSSTTIRATFNKQYASAARQRNTDAVAWGTFVGLLIGLVVLLVIFAIVIYFELLRSTRAPPPWDQLRDAYEKSGALKSMPSFLRKTTPKTQEEVLEEERAKWEAREARRKNDAERAEMEKTEKARIKEAERKVREAERKLQGTAKRNKPSAFFERLRSAAQAAPTAPPATTRAPARRRASWGGPAPWPQPPVKEHPSGAQTLSCLPNLGKGSKAELKKAKALWADDVARVRAERAAGPAASSSSLAVPMSREEAKKVYEGSVSRNQLGMLSPDEIAALAAYGFLDAAMAAQLTQRARPQAARHTSLAEIKLVKQAAPAAPPLAPAISGSVPSISVDSDELPLMASATAFTPEEIDSLPKPPPQHELYAEEASSAASLAEAASAAEQEAAAVSADEASTPVSVPSNDSVLVPIDGEESNGAGGETLATDPPADAPPPPPPLPLPPTTDLPAPIQAPDEEPPPPPAPTAPPAPVARPPHPVLVAQVSARQLTPAPLSPPGDARNYDSDDDGTFI